MKRRIGPSPWLPQARYGHYVKIWNFNMCNHCGKFPTKVPEMASEVAELDKASNIVSDLFAFSETRNDDKALEFKAGGAKKKLKGAALGFAAGLVSGGFVGAGIGAAAGWGLQQKYLEIKFRCGEKKRYTPECFGVHWRSALGENFPLISRQYGELGLLANGRRFELVGSFIKEEIDRSGFLDRGPGLLLLGARLRITGSNHILPFYVTHLRGGGGRKAQAFAYIIRHATENRTPGDLPPVVVGDFNFNYSDNPSLWGVMEQYFDEMTRYLGPGGIYQFWVGKPSKFPDAGDKLVPVEGSFFEGRVFFEMGRWFGDYTDAVCPSVELSIQKR